MAGITTCQCAKTVNTKKSKINLAMVFFVKHQK